MPLLELWLGWLSGIDVMADPIETIPGELHELRDYVTQRFREGDARFNRIEASLAENTRKTDEVAKSIAENTESTQRVEKNTGELVEFFGSMQAAFKLFNMLGSLAKPVGYIAAAVAAVVGAWVALKGGK